MALVVMALLDWEGWQLDVKMAFLEADVTEELYVELPDGYRDLPNQVGLVPSTPEKAPKSKYSVPISL